MWYEPTFPANKMWLIDLKNIAPLECSTARINKAQTRTIKAWTEFIEKLPCNTAIDQIQ